MDRLRIMWVCNLEIDNMPGYMFMVHVTTLHVVFNTYGGHEYGK